MICYSANHYHQAVFPWKICHTSQDTLFFFIAAHRVPLYQCWVITNVGRVFDLTFGYLLGVTSDIYIYIIIRCCFFKNLAPPSTHAFQKVGTHPHLIIRALEAQIFVTILDLGKTMQRASIKKSQIHTLLVPI